MTTKHDINPILRHANDHDYDNATILMHVVPIYRAEALTGNRMVKAFIRTQVLTALKNKVFQDMSHPALNDKAFQGRALTAFMHYAMDSTCVYLHTTINTCA